MDANNVLKEWLDTHYEITRRDSDRIGACVLKQAYIAEMAASAGGQVERMWDQLFRAQMEFNKINRRKMECGMLYTGIKRRVGS